MARTGTSSSTKPTIVIGVMGVTGSGKSNFIRIVSGRDDVVVGHGLEACTQKVMACPFATEEYNVILVDTPGFNDTYRSDTEILLDLARWLEVKYRQDAKLTGIIYLHRITDMRMDGSAMRNLKMFRKLCGDQPMKNVVIASTFWGVMPEATEKAHEAELQSTPSFWGDMIAHGAAVRRFTNTAESGLSLLSLLASKATITLDIQRELVDEQKELRDTAAGSAVNEDLHRLEKNYREELSKLKEETAAALAEKDVELQKALLDAQTRMERRLERVHNDQAAFQGERREEVRRLTAENDRRVLALQHEWQTRLDQQRVAADRAREQDQSGLRDQMRRLEIQNTTASATFERQMRDMQQVNESLAMRAQTAEAAAASASSRGADESGGGNIGEKIGNLAVSGVLAFVQPVVGIPLALGSLFDLLNEL